MMSYGGKCVSGCLRQPVAGRLFLEHCHYGVCLCLRTETAGVVNLLFFLSSSSPSTSTLKKSPFIRHNLSHTHTHTHTLTHTKQKHIHHITYIHHIEHCPKQEH
jgi:hypothetical protein